MFLFGGLLVYTPAMGDINIPTLLFLIAAIAIPLATLGWLYNKNPGYAFTAVLVLSVAMAGVELLL